MSTKKHPPGFLARALVDLAMLILPRSTRGDATYAKLRFFVHHGRWPTDAKRFNDMLLRRRISPEFRSQLVALTTDKAAAKAFTRLVVGEEHVIPTYAVLRSKEEIWSYGFPDRCVIKGTAASGQVIFKESDNEVNRNTLVSWLKRTQYSYTREPNYKPFPNAVIVEPFVDGIGPVHEFKMQCYQGRVRFIYQNISETSGQTRILWDTNWQPLDLSFNYEAPDEIPETPSHAVEMMTAAEKVAAYFDLVRVDIYSVGDQFFLGEITHSTECADGSFVPLVEGELTINRLMFGTEAHEGPYEEHGAIGAKGPRAH